MMKYNTLGNSTLKVSEVSFGCMSLGDNHQDGITLLQNAFDKGINFFDTADLYQNGANEEIVGKAFKHMRGKVVLATKVGNQLRSDGSGWDWNPGKSYILQAVEQSLKRLQTEYIDLYQLHGGTIEDPIDETIEAFEILKEQGKIRQYGISSIRPNVIREWVKRSNMVSVMMQYSLLDRRPEEECLGLLHVNSIAVLARGVLAKGLLAGKEATDYLEHSQQDVQAAARAIQSVSGTDRNMPAIALNYVLHHPAVSTAVAGIRTHDQLIQSIRAAHGAALLTEQEMQRLRSSVKTGIYQQHR
jgi:aryl-alcohol dehydrogenase-like predicted oxidoreductase